MQRCRLLQFSVGDYSTKVNTFQQELTTRNTGVLVPKDNKCIKVMIQDDNPDIQKINTELKLTRQALKEYKRRMKYDIKVFSYGQIEEKDADVFINFVDQENDNYLTNNVNAYGGFPNSSFRGKIVLNNSRIWLDGQLKTCETLKQLGLIKNCIPFSKIITYNYKRTIKHEFGHVLGLEHSSGVMSSTYDYDENMLGLESLEVLNIKYDLVNVGIRWLRWIKAVMTRKEF